MRRHTEVLRTWDDLALVSLSRPGLDNFSSGGTSFAELVKAKHGWTKQNEWKQNESQTNQSQSLWYQELHTASYHQWKQNILTPLARSDGFRLIFTWFGQQIKLEGRKNGRGVWHLLRAAILHPKWSTQCLAWFWPDFIFSSLGLVWHPLCLRHQPPWPNRMMLTQWSFFGLRHVS